MSLAIATSFHGLQYACKHLCIIYACLPGHVKVSKLALACKATHLKEQKTPDPYADEIDTLKKVLKASPDTAYAKWSEEQKPMAQQ